MTRHVQSQKMWMECSALVSKTHENEDKPTNSAM